MTATIPSCRTCGYRADQCAQIRSDHGDDHAYDGPPWNPPPAAEVRPSRRTPAAWPRPNKD